MFTYTCLMRYLRYSMEDIQELTNSYVAKLVEMLGAIKDPKALDKYNIKEFETELDFDLWLRGKFGV